MADIIFINRTDVKWNDTFDSYLISSVVGGDTEAGAEMTLGSSEVLSATANIVSVAVSLYTTGVVEVLASSEIATSSTPAADLTLGIVEPLSSTIGIVSTISGFINMGLAEDLSSSIAIVSTTNQTLELGIVEVVSSTIINTSVVSGPLLTIGQAEAFTSSQIVQSIVSGLLDLGVSELLASTAINASTTDAVLHMGAMEWLSSTATCVVTETDKELTIGIENPLSTGVVIQSTSVSLLDLGVSELLASTEPISSTVSAADLELGQDEELSSTIGIVSIVSVPDLELGQDEELSSTIDLVIPVSIPQLVLGIQEATASTGSIVSTVLNSELTLGGPAACSSTIVLESIVSSFLIIGRTEVLESSIGITTTTSTPDFLLGEQELLSAIRATVSETATAELTIGIDEPLSRNFNNPEFINDSSTRLLYNFNSLPIVDESNYDHDASSNTTGLSGDPIFGVNSLDLGSGGSLEVGNVDSSLDFGSGTFAIEFWMKDTGTKDVGDGYYVYKRSKFTGDTGWQGVYDASAYDTETVGYAKQSNGTINLFYISREFQYWLGAGFSHIYHGGSLNISLPADGLDEWTHVAIFRESGKIWFGINGIIVDYSIYTDYPNLTGGTFEFGEKIGTYTDPELNIDSFRISSESRYTSDNFDPITYIKDVHTTTTADITLGLQELLASTQTITSEVDAEMGFGGNEPLSHTTLITSNVSAPNIILGITESLAHSCFTVLDEGSLDGGDLFIDCEGGVVEDENGVHSPVVKAGVSLTNTERKRGYYSLYFDGSQTGRVTIPDHGDWTINDSDFTIDMWVRFPVLEDGTFISHWRTDGDEKGWALSYEASGQLVFWFSTDGSDDQTKDVSWTASVDTWYHIAVTREDDDLKFYVDGTQVGTTQTLSISIHNSSSNLRLGCYRNGSNYPDTFTGYLDQIRFDEKKALWTTSFDVDDDAEMFYEYSNKNITSIVSQSVVSPVLTLGFTELLASTIATTSTATDSILIIGGSEILTSIGGVVVDTTVNNANLVLGIPEALSSTQNIVSVTSSPVFLSGGAEILDSDATAQSLTVAWLTIGQFEYLSSTQNTISTVSTSALILGVTEDLSSSIGPIGTVSTSLLDLGVTEILADVDNILSSSVTGDLHLGQDELLAHTLYEFSSDPHGPYANSVTTGLIDLGVDEILGSSQSTTSITTATITIGGSEVLSSSIIIDNPEEVVELTLGIDEPLSDEAVSWTSISGLLTVGLTEILTVTSISNSVADAVLTLGVDEPIAHTIGDSTIPGQVLDTGDLFIDGESVIQDENATHTVTPQGGTAVSTTEFKYGESSIYFDGDGDGLTIADHTDFDVTKDFTFDTWVNVSDLTDWDRLFIIQNDEDNYFQVYILDNKIVCRFSKNGNLYAGIVSDTISTGTWYHIAFTHVNSSNTIKMYVDGTEVTGSSNVALEDITFFNGYLDNIRWESDTIRWTSNFDSDDDEELFYETPDIPELYAVSNTVADLKIGVETILSATINNTTVATGLTLVTGVAEVLASATFSVSVTTANLILGVDEPLSSSIGIVSNISSILTLGVDEPLSATNNISILTVAEIGFGVSEFIGTSVLSQSTADANLVLGVSEQLSATSIVEQSVVALLGFGIVEQASVSTTFTSSSDALLTLGIVEPLSSTITPSTEFDADVTLGEDVEFSGAPLVQSLASAYIILGVSELLGTTATSTATTDASLTIGIGEDLTATGIVVSNTIAWITLGVSEPLSSTQNIVSSGDAVPILGVDEVLSAANPTIQSLTTADLFVGGMEMLSATIGPISTTSISLLDLGVSEVLGSAGPIYSNVGSTTLTLGAAEDLSFTCTTNVVGETGDLFIDGEDIIEDENGTHTITNHGSISIENESVYGNSSIYFNGSSWLSVANHSDFDLSSNNFTIDGWYKFDSLPSLQLLASHWSVTNDNRGWTLQWENGGDSLKFYWTTNGLSATSSFISASWLPEIDTWYHIAVVRDNNNIKLYVDGSQVGSTETITDTIYNANADFTIHSANGIAYGDGNVDNLRIINGTSLWDSNFDTDTDLDYPGKSINTYVADSEVNPVLTLGISTPLSSTINFTTESDGSIATGILEVLGTLGFGITIATADITMGVDEPLSATNNIVSVVNGELGIPGAIEALEHTLITPYVTTEADAISLDTGVMEMVSAFKMIWSQIHTPPLTLGLTELISGTTNTTSLVGTADLIKGLAEMLSSTSISNSVADAVLTLGIGEYLQSTVNVLSISDGLLSTGDDELLASSIISTGAVAGELILGLVEVISATRVTNTVVVGQLYAGIEEILESTTEKGNGANAVMGLNIILGRTPCSMRHNRERSRNGGIFITS